MSTSRAIKKKHLKRGACSVYDKALMQKSLTNLNY